MPDEPLRLVSLSVLGGSLHGRRFDPPDVVGEILIGSDPDCHLVVELPSISPIHARVWADLGGAKVRDTHAPSGVFVNAERVVTEASVGETDMIWLGPPNEPGSVCIQCRFEPWVEVLPGAGGPVVEAEPIVEAEPAPKAAAVDAGDPFFIGSEEPVAAASAPAPEPVVAAAEPKAPADDAWAIVDQPQLDAAAPQPSVATPPSAEGPDEFFVADEPVAAQAVKPAPPAPAPPVPAQVATPPQPGTPPASPVVLSPAPAGAPQPSPVAAPKAPVAPVAPSPKLAPTAAAPAPAARPAPGGPKPPAGAPGPAKPAAPSRPASAIAPPAGPKQPSATPPRPSIEPPHAARPVAEPSPRRAGISAGPRPTPSPRRPSPAGRAPARRGSPGSSGWVRAASIGAVGLVVLGVAAFGVWRLWGEGVQLQAVEPARARVGQRAAILGRGFAADPTGNRVLFDELSAKVLTASPTRLEIEVPESVVEAGSERRVNVVVRRGRRASAAFVVSVLQGPRLHGISPEAALAGEEVLLAGAGWGVGASVRFGGTPAQVVQVEASRIRVIVPEGVGAPGTAAPVVVAVGGVESNSAPFVVGHLPVITSVTPGSAGPGDLIRVTGVGFGKDPLSNDVRVAGVSALVVSAADGVLTVAVPRVGPGEAARSLELRVPGNANLGTATIEVAAPTDPIELRFVAEPFTAVPGRPYAVVATGLGPAFVLAAAGGHSAAERALSAAERLNQAIPTLRTTLGLNLEARGFERDPILALAGRAETLVEISEQDAVAYNEDWSGLRGRGGAVTRARLARWWEAVGRDLVLLLVRGERPRFAAELAPEGRALGLLFDAAQKTGRPGVPLAVLDQARPPLRDGLRLLALRVPAQVTAPAAPVAAGLAPVATAAAAAPSPSAAPRLELEGTFRGSELESGERRYLTVAFHKGEGTIAYEGGITLTMPLLSLEQRGRDQARFSVRIRGGMRYYAGKWDGERLTGSISSDPAGRDVVASFELHR